ncbi:hypothetical protein CIB93_17860 [Streptomyces sp. WZ.A104]|uniref:hypothetical protein n=1 Tax=Streptomyces sp. WZ.A104 TaxID=2023771 RepID=UPI000BBC2778|nr:hypothetical protein [Streptomyces sp. WZ.A104]PCG84709.1 hypothetical protein CIB93_17860 [Streptomyces sp. WZ.A104]
MDTQQNTALMRALAEVPGPLPARGVIHIAIPHTERFTVVGNHLAQHTALSATALGVAVRIQSLPRGTEVGVKALASRFPEGEKLIATALRELEAHGYLQRTVVRLPNGRIATRTVYCNHPEALLHPRAAPTPQLPPASRQPRTQAQQAQAQAPVPDPAPTPLPDPGPVPEPPTQPATEPNTPTARLVPPPTAPKAPPRPLPRPRELTPELRRTAAALLTDLRRHTHELTLTEDAVERLTPAMAAWLEREAHPDAIRHALTTDLPQPVNHPAQFVRHRLIALLPPPLPGTQETTPVRAALVIPMQNCDGCERGFRARTPGLCRACRTNHEQTAA